MIPAENLSDPAVRSLVMAINAGDRAAFMAACTPDVALTDDGSERDLPQWIDREIFSANGHMDVESQSDDGLSLMARYRNDTWGDMRTQWAFTVDDDKVSRIDTGQA